MMDNDLSSHSDRQLQWDNDSKETLGKYYLNEDRTALKPGAVPDTYYSGTEVNRIIELVRESMGEYKEPKWGPGDVVKDANGTVFSRGLVGGWWALGTSSRFDHDTPKRPLKKLTEEE